MSSSPPRRENRDLQYDHHTCIVNMVTSAGKTILVSGTTLTLCFVGLCFFKLDILVSLGAACATSICCIMIVNLVLTPTLMLLFPVFFAKCTEPSRYWPPSEWCARRSDASDSGSRAKAVAADEGTALLTPGADKDAEAVGKDGDSSPLADDKVLHQLRRYGTSVACWTIAVLKGDH